MVVPLVTSMVAPRPVLAQGVALGNEQSAIIVDFENKTNAQGDLLAKFVTTAVANELEGTGKYIFLPAKDVTRQAEEDGRKPPYDQVALTSIASKLGAPTIVKGEISKVWIDAKQTPKVVRVGVKIRMVEASSGDTLNGAAQVGQAIARPGQDDDSLVQEAARNAVTLGVQQIMTYTLPEGIILTVIGSGGEGTALINKGHTDGLRVGTEMIVFRGRVRTGKIVVTKTEARDSEARVVQNIFGIRAEDHVRAIFPMPDFAKEGVVSGIVGRKGPSIANLGTLLVTFLVGAVIYAVVQGAARSTVTDVSAEASLTNVTSGTPTVLVQWRDNLFAGQVLEYQIWRNRDWGYNPQTGTPIGTSLSVRRYEDQVGISFYTNGAEFLRATKSASDQTTTGAEAEATTPDTLPYGPTVGVSYTYPVSSILRRVPLSSGGTGTGGTTPTSEDVWSEPVTTGQATPIAQPGLISPADHSETVDISKFNPIWQSKAGANHYVIEVSWDSTFGSPSVIAKVAEYSVSSTSDNMPLSLDSPITTLPTNSVLLSNLAFSNYVNNGIGQPQLFWRVGARNDSDSPGPVHVFSRNRADADKAWRYIYSAPLTFKPVPKPPAGP